MLPVQGQVFMVTGAGGNVTLQAGPDGVLVVDSGAAGQTDKLLAAMARVSSKPVRFLVNTNADPDHIAGNRGVVQSQGGVRGPRPGGVGGGNPLGQNAGVMTMSHENAYNRMSVANGPFPALTGEGLPESTFFTPRKEFFSNGEPVQLYSQPGAHTDGDILVFFRKSDVVSTGDVFVTTSYPVIDIARGGIDRGHRRRAQQHHRPHGAGAEPDGRHARRSRAMAASATRPTWWTTATWSRSSATVCRPWSRKA